MSWTILLAILIQIESGGDHSQIGDRHLKNKAYGILQIRQPYLDDVNRIYRKSILKAYGRPLTMGDIRKSPKLSRWVTVHYLKYYGKKYYDKTGKFPTYEEYVRMHAGGPNGWRKDSTDLHWSRFRVRLLKHYENRTLMSREREREKKKKEAA